jgi:hypothetical protein
MSMITATLTAGTWYEFVDLDDPSAVQFYLDSTDQVLAALEAGTPSSTSAAFFCAEGMNQFAIPPGKSCWVKLTSGTADVIYSQYDGIDIDGALCAFARSDGVSVDDLEINTFPVAGYDDSAADVLTYVGLLHTEAAGIASTATIDAATMTLSLGRFKIGRTIRIFGIEEAASITSSLTDYASLASGQTLTTAYEEITIDGSGQAVADLTAVIQELIDDTASWTTASPIQLWIGDNGGSPTAGLDETVVILGTGRVSALFVRAS